MNKHRNKKFKTKSYHVVTRRAWYDCDRYEQINDTPEAEDDKKYMHKSII